MRPTRSIVATGLAAALALTAVDLRPSAAAPKAPDIQAAQEVGATDISARKRRYSQNRRGDAAAGAAVLGVFGAIAGAAAANRSRRDYYYGPSRYYYGRSGYSGYAPYRYAPYRQNYGYRHYGGGAPGGPGYNYGPTPHGFIGSPGY